MASFDLMKQVSLDRSLITPKTRTQVFFDQMDKVVSRYELANQALTTVTKEAESPEKTPLKRAASQLDSAQKTLDSVR